MANFFADRPVFAWVLAIFIVVAGMIAITRLPIAQYPSIAPPSVVVRATYPGASAETLDQSVASVIDQQMNGAEGLLYVESQSQSNGTASIRVSFQSGSNAELAAVDVQNRLKRVEARLPQAVTQQGVQVLKSASNFLMVVSLASVDPKLDPVALGDYASRNVLDEIRRIPGVGEATLFGSERAMRIWLDPAKLEGFKLGAADVVNAIRAQNLQVAAGALGELPALSQQPLAPSIALSGQLEAPAQFGAIVLRANPDGSAVQLRDVADIQLGAQSYATSARINGRPATAIGIQQTPAGNALETAAAVKAKMQELSRHFPAGVSYTVPFDTSTFVRLSIQAVVVTLLEAVVLVFLVMYLFLQSWRTTLIPTLVVPIALLGAFAAMMAFGFSINVLTMFGLVLAIGIVVDDAIVVIENVERIMAEERLPPREATHKAMGQITGAVVGMTLVLVSVFIPMAFFGGAVGAIYRQFSLSLVAAIALSAVMALSLTPALCASFLKPGAHAARKGFFGWFNRGFGATTRAYQGLVARVLRRTGRAMLVYAVVAASAAFLFLRLPTGFLPSEDQGIVLTNVQLPPAASANRTLQVMEQVERFYMEQPATQNVVAITGFSFSGSASNAGLAFVALKPWEERAESAEQLVRRAFGAFMATIRDAIVFPLNPPPIPALGTASGFDMRLQNRAGLDYAEFSAARDKLLAAARQSPVLAQVRVDALEDAPQIELDIDRSRASAQGVLMADVGTALGAAFGSIYVNDFPSEGRQQRVLLQAEPDRRMLPQDIASLTVRNAGGEMVPFSSFGSARWTTGPVQLTRYNGYPAFKVSGQAAPGLSTGDAMAEMERLVGALGRGIGLEWSGTSYEERLTGAQTPLLYSLSALAVFLVLAALYESWSIPIAVMLVVPLGVLGTALFTGARGYDNDVYFNVGMLAVMGLSAKNAILIVEFAKDLHAQGKGLVEATLEAVALRFRPILMTSFAFILGVLPLAVASGASSASQRAIGTAVAGGMLTGTVLAVVLVPAFFVVVSTVFSWKKKT